MNSFIDKTHSTCNRVSQGYSKGVYETILKDSSTQPAYKSALRFKNGQRYGLRKSIHLSLPEE